jgi:hypothetical protein
LRCAIGAFVVVKIIDEEGKVVTDTPFDALIVVR